jgi:hypothetical protein
VSTPPPPPPEFEVLPPAGKAEPGQHDAAARLIAFVMDNLIQVPGTKARVGINPFLDLIPVFGDSAAVLISALTIFEGFRRRLPKVVLTRMGLNVLLNGLIGVIPVAGEAFSFWFKPTSRNFRLLQLHSAPGGTARQGSQGSRSTWHEWAFLIALLILVLVGLGIFFGLGIYITFRVARALVG